MGSVRTVRILLAVILGVMGEDGSMRVKEVSFKINAARCLALSKDPYFDAEQVIGKPWRVYYSWNVVMPGKCLDMTFKMATPMIINRIYNDMHEYVEYQPNWDAAVLYGTIGAARHEILLIADQGAAGTFLGVPNLARDGNIAPMRQGVPILKFYLKLLKDSNYLLMVDCNTGIASLSSRLRPPWRTEVASIANSVNLGTGEPACITEKKPGEQILV